MLDKECHFEREVKGSQLHHQFVFAMNWIHPFDLHSLRKFRDAKRLLWNDVSFY